MNLQIPRDNYTNRRKCSTIIVCICLLFCCCQKKAARTNLNLSSDSLYVNNANRPIVKFEKSTYNFGTVISGTTVRHKFRVSNTGPTPLLIKTAVATCGCTVAHIPTNPILPGESDVIDVVFSTKAKWGIQRKVITVFSNARTSRHMLALVGNVK